MATTQVILCPYCGHSQTQITKKCESCRGLFDTLSLRATQISMGPWFIRDERNPYRPGCSYEELKREVQAGVVKPDTVMRGPTTRQFWALARNVAGVAHLLGNCHLCGASARRSDRDCRVCGAPFREVPVRNELGLYYISEPIAQMARGAIEREMDAAVSPAPANGKTDAPPNGSLPGTPQGGMNFSSTGDTVALPNPNAPPPPPPVFTAPISPPSPPPVAREFVAPGAIPAPKLDPPTDAVDPIDDALGRLTSQMQARRSSAGPGHKPRSGAGAAGGAPGAARASGFDFDAIEEDPANPIAGSTSPRSRRPIRRRARSSNVINIGLVVVLLFQLGLSTFLFLSAASDEPPINPLPSPLSTPPRPAQPKPMPKPVVVAPQPNPIDNSQTPKPPVVKPPEPQLVLPPTLEGRMDMAAELEARKKYSDALKVLKEVERTTPLSRQPDNLEEDIRRLEGIIATLKSGHVAPEIMAPSSVGEPASISAEPSPKPPPAPVVKPPEPAMVLPASVEDRMNLAHELETQKKYSDALKVLKDVERTTPLSKQPDNLEEDIRRIEGIIATEKSGRFFKVDS